MFRTIVLKELADSARSLRFIVGWLVMLALMVAAVLLLSEDVRRRGERQELIERSQSEYVSEYGHTNRIGYVLRPSRPPERSEVLFRGLDDEAESGSFFSDPVAKLFPQLDLLFIVSVLLSLMAVIFTYDSVCGEREDGTLRQLHTGPVSRATVILGKWVGAWIALGAPFLAVYLLVILLAAAIGGLPLGLDTALELTAIALASLVYLAFFLCLGLLVSSLVKHSGTSILILLFLWVMFVVGIPNAAPIFASQLRPIPSVNAVERQTRLLTDIIRDNRLVEEGELIVRQLREQYDIPDLAVERWWEPSSLTALGWSEEEAEEIAESYARMWSEAITRVNREQSAQANALWEELERKIEAQSELARSIALLSPTPSFSFFATDLASVGLRAEEHFHEEVGGFYEEFYDFLEERERSEEERLGRRIGANEFLDMSGRPRLTHRPEPVAARLEAGLLAAGHLVIMTLIALIAAVVAYLRYDVR